MQKTILITGGAGFIGSHLSEKFQQENYKVIIIDNLFRGKIENIQNLLELGAFFYNIDLVDNNQMLNVIETIKKYKPDYIAHYAAINGTQYFYDIPHFVAETNSIGTYNLLKCLNVVIDSDNSYKPSVIFASTSETYGEPFEIPSLESSVTYARIDEARDSYAAAKLMSEFYIKLFSESMKINWMIFRIFNVYGPRMIGTKYGQVIPEFITRLREGEYPLNIFGDGSHKRSFIYITDHVELAFRAITKARYNSVYNLGNPEEISIKEVAAIIMKKMSLEPFFNFTVERIGDHKRRQPSIEKLINEIGEYKMLSIVEGIEKMVTNY